MNSLSKLIFLTSLSLPVSGMAQEAFPQPPRPNVVIILVDDMGWSDIGPYGGEIQTPALDRLADGGLRFTRAYNTSKCNPSRTCLLTGVYAQEAGIINNPAIMYNIVTIGEVLRSAGYRTLAVGKHHGLDNLYDLGFDRYWGMRDGAGNHFNPGLQRDGEPEPAKKPQVATRYWADDATVFAATDPAFQDYFPADFYTTDAFTDKALEFLDQYGNEPEPFLLYVAYTAPHDPIQAWPEDIAKYDGVYDSGYAAIREARYARQIESGLIDAARYPLSNPIHRNWGSLPSSTKTDQIRRMQVYAAMIDRIDQGVGQIRDKLEALGSIENTLILFCSDNGASASSPDIGTGVIGEIDRYSGIGLDWANVSNTPFRFHKTQSYEGGINTPLIAHWPGGITYPGRVVDSGPIHFIDFMPTLIELSGASYPVRNVRDEPVKPLSGQSFATVFSGNPLPDDRLLHWEYASGEAILSNSYKAVRRDKTWELFDTSTNRTETVNILAQNSGLGNKLIGNNTIWKLLAPKAPPNAARDAFRLAVQAEQALDVLANDPGNIRTSSLALVQVPGRGEATVDASIIRYAPYPGESGLDWFSYQVTSPGGITSQPIPVYVWIGDQAAAAQSLTNLYPDIVAKNQYRAVLETLPSLPGTLEYTTSLESPDWQPVMGRGEVSGDGVFFIDTIDQESPVFMRFVLDQAAFE